MYQILIDILIHFHRFMRLTQISAGAKAERKKGTKVGIFYFVSVY